MTEPSHAIFLSYASQDAEAAQRICEALRAAGFEVWFDREELRGGDAWEQRICQQILDCRLFVPIISVNTETRLEGYFRREWKLATDRTESMANELAFLIPVVIDSTPNTSAHVPEKFRHVQWTRFESGQVPRAFVERVRQLLTPEASFPQAATWVRRGSSSSSISVSPVRRSWRSNLLLWVAAVGLAMALAYIAVVSRHTIAPTSPSTSAAQTVPRADTSVAFNPPPHSIAVLPFVNMSGDKEQEYFSDGLTEELLNSLSHINALQVAARTSAFSFKGKDTDIGTIARKLNVGAVLEGSVRRSGHTIRITTQLINAVTGFHLWSETYDRDLGDVLKLQTEISTAVASSLKVALLGDEAAKIEVGGTRNPAALDAYLRAAAIYWGGVSPTVIATAAAGYTAAIRLDPDYALAYAARSLAHGCATNWDTTSSAIRADLDRAQADAAKAIALAPDLSEGYLARAIVHQCRLEFGEAVENYEHALALAPGNARVLRDYGAFAVAMGHSESGLTAVRRAVVLDPLNFISHGNLGAALTALRRYPEALAALKDAEALPSTTPGPFLGEIGSTYYLLGDFVSARTTCEQNRDDPEHQACLALAYDRLGRHADAKAELNKIQRTRGDAGIYLRAQIYSQWGNRPKALESLESALRLRDSGLIYVKTDPLLDPLRQEPRFQAVMKALKFPD